MHQRLLINGKWTESARTAEVTNKYTGQVIATVAQAEESDVRRAVAAAEQAAPLMAATPLHRRAAWLTRLPEQDRLDLYAYRFTGFGFVFWGIAMLAGSIWAYNSWGRYWGWDPVETWSLVTWLMLGIYLHLRRFFRWSGPRAAWLLVACFAMSLFALFVASHMGSSIHAEYFP